MRLSALFAFVTIAAVGVLAGSQPAQEIIDDAVNALGGKERVLAVNTLVIDGTATAWNLGQDVNPGATGQTFTLSGYRHVIDLANGRDRLEQTRTPNFVFFNGQAPQKQITGTDRDIGYNVAANGNATRVSVLATRNRRVEMLHHPLTLLRAALDPAATFANYRTADRQRLVDITTASGLSVTLGISTSTKLPVRVISKTDNPNLGDVVVETTFTDYESIGGLRLPARLATKTDKYPTTEVRVSKYTVNGDGGDLAAPAAAVAAAPFEAPPPIVVTVTELGTGVWLLGPGYNGVVVEFADHLTLIEGLQNEARALAVIAKARDLRPGKPLTEVVNTHFHFDHSGGLRAAVSEGLTIITLSANRSFYREMVARKHTIAPDALARNPKPLKLHTVDDVGILKDGTMAVQLYRIAGTIHADALLMAYIPSERLLVEADAYSTNTVAQPFAPNLVENLQRLKLSVERVGPIHGTVIPFSELVKAADRARSEHGS